MNDIFGIFSLLPPEILRGRVQERLEKMARFSPVTRFILVESDERKFRSERWSYLGDIDDWINIGEAGKLEKMARRLIPKLGTDDFF